uniref:ATFIP1(V) (Arabidopsis homolog of yeast Fip1 (V)) n=1 Tax=Arundo donax TaxID=35708 RepID=A0A0A9FAM0_ARUDO
MSRWPPRLPPRGRAEAPTRGTRTRPATARGRCRTRMRRPTRTRRLIWGTGRWTTAAAAKRKALTVSA